jgi:outer membrane protein TolC
VGNFPTWYGERETNDAGEFSAGFGIPLLKDRLIDKRRAGVLRADWAREAVEPALQAQLLEFVRIASRFYWAWVAAGRSLEAQRELLQNAQARVRQIQEKVGAGDLPRIARINNEQLIAARETKVIESERKLQEAAIKLSLFVRDNQGQPIIPDNARLPSSFPAPQSPASEEVQEEIQRAVAASPLLAELDLIAEQVRVDLQAAQNMLLPKLDARLLAAKDIGGPASSKRDKSPFQLEVGLYGEVPLQRRAAQGKIAAAEAKLAQINAKRNFVVNKITAAVQDAVSALQASAERIERADTNLELARETLRLGRLQFDAGDIDLVTLNIYEKSVSDAQLLRIAAYADFYIALADYRAALATDPLLATP